MSLGAQEERGSLRQLRLSSFAAKYPSEVLIDDGDIKALIQMGDVLTGLESQGNPDYRPNRQSRLASPLQSAICGEDREDGGRCHLKMNK